MNVVNSETNVIEDDQRKTREKIKVEKERKRYVDMKIKVDVRKEKSVDSSTPGESVSPSAGLVPVHTTMNVNFATQLKIVMNMKGQVIVHMEKNVSSAILSHS